MTSITVEEVAAQGSSNWKATVSFNNGPRYSATIADPFSRKQEEDLEWYFEGYLRFPFTDQVKAARAATSIRAYGETLFNQLFADHDPYAAYKDCLAAGLHTIQIENLESAPLYHPHWGEPHKPQNPTPPSLHG